jgi:hypothetical protein
VISVARLVLLLIAANLAWAAWSQGWLRPLGLDAQPQTEPERLARQVRPEAVRIQPMHDEAASAAPEEPASRPPAAAAPEPSHDASEAAPPASASVVAQPPTPATVPAPAVRSVCLQAGVFDDRQIAAVRRAAAELPAGSWRVDQVSLPGRWMVYVGKLADEDAMRAKKAELRALGVDTDRPGAALEPGLSLGRFANEDAAHRALTDLTRRGVRTARVVQERRDNPAYVLRLPRADDALRQRVRRLNALAGKELRACE